MSIQDRASMRLERSERRPDAFTSTSIVSFKGRSECSDQLSCTAAPPVPDLVRLQHVNEPCHERIGVVVGLLAVHQLRGHKQGMLLAANAASSPLWCPIPLAE